VLQGEYLRILALSVQCQSLVLQGCIQPVSLALGIGTLKVRILMVLTLNVCMKIEYVCLHSQILLP